MNTFLVAIMVFLPDGLALPAELDTIHFIIPHPTEQACLDARTRMRFMWGKTPGYRVVGTLDCTDGTVPKTMTVGASTIQVDEVPVPEPIDFSTVQVTPYAPQHGIGGNAGSFTVEDNGASVRLLANAWVKALINYPVTAKTILDFDFTEITVGEIHGVAFDVDETQQTPPRIFRLSGTQGSSTTHIRDFTYTGAGKPQHFTIPIGEYFTGTQTYLVLVNDNDTSPSGESLFSNVTLTEAP